MFATNKWSSLWGDRPVQHSGTANSGYLHLEQPNEQLRSSLRIEKSAEIGDVRPKKNSENYTQSCSKRRNSRRRYQPWWKSWNNNFSPPPKWIISNSRAKMETYLSSSAQKHHENTPTRGVASKNKGVLPFSIISDTEKTRKNEWRWWDAGEE